MTIGIFFYFVLLVALHTSAATTGGGICNATSQCLNSGTCFGLESVSNSSNKNSTGVCHCAEKFTGDYCATQCLLQCLNGGTCLYTPNEHSQGDIASLSDFTCTCPKGWKGITCSIQYTKCLDGKQCLHGSACRRTGDGDDTVDDEASYVCECDPDYEGDVCETLRTAKEKERLQDTTTTAASADISSSTRRFSGGESFGITLGVGLAIGIIVGVLIMSHRRRQNNALQSDAYVMDMDAKSSYNEHDNVNVNANDSGTGNGVGNSLELNVETVNDNEII